jgi:mannose-1-phosphate guanylyltransferase
MVCCPADHLISPLDGFRRSVIEAAEAASAGRVVVIGIPPASATTGYGYIQPGEELANAAGAYRVTGFHEKPDQEAALAHVRAGCLWNAGIFIWSVETIGREYATHLPALASQMDELAAAAAGGRLAEELPRIWSRISDRTTVDYGVLERSGNVACVRAAFEWSDVGSWDALAEALEADDDGNHVEGDAVVLDSTGTLVLSRAGRMVAVSGVRDMVVVDTPDALVVIPRERAQDVRAIVDALRAAGRTDLL